MPVPMPDQFRRIGTELRPDEDGPVRQEMPPPPRAVNSDAQSWPPRIDPMGQANPSQSQMQYIPGLGVVTSSQPGVVIQNPPRPGGAPAVTTPTQPRRGGGGG